MASTSKCSKRNIEVDAADVAAASCASTLEPPSSSPIEQRLCNMSRRNATSLATGQTAASAIHTQPALHDDTIMGDAADSPAETAQAKPAEYITALAAAGPPSPRCQTSQNPSPGPIKPHSVICSQPLESEEISPKWRKKSKDEDAANESVKTPRNTVMFPNLIRSSIVEVTESEDLSRYVVDASPLPDFALESSPSRDKGKGNAADTNSSFPTLQDEACTLRGTKSLPSAYAAKQIVSSLKRRFANYAVAHPPGWFDDLPAINEDLFKDSPHKEYKMVLIHTARCNVCLQYNRGTLFMCADCTVSICEGCADDKCGVAPANAANAAAWLSDVMIGGSEKESSGEGSRKVTLVPGYDASTREDGYTGEGSKRKFEWCGPYHETFRGAYLEWKAANDKGDFTSTDGVEFKLSTCKLGGRKRKAIARMMEWGY